MKSRFYNGFGKTDRDGKLLVSSRPEMLEFFRMWPNRSVILVFEVCDEGTRGPMLGYYHKVVVPRFMNGLIETGNRMNEKDTDRFIREASRITNASSPENEKILRIEDLSDSEMVGFLEECKQMAAENFQIIIPDPN